MKPQDTITIRDYITERFEVITKPTIRQAMDKYGFWLDPAETIIVNGVKNYRVIFPRSVKGGWADSYSTPVEAHIPADARTNTLTHGIDTKNNPC